MRPERGVLGGGAMSRRIRVVGIVLLACFVLLFVQLNNVQVVKAHQYATAKGNPRTQAAVAQDPRGVIEASDGTILAESVPAPAHNAFGYRYQRVYPQGALYAEVVGYDSPLYGLTGVESSYDAELTAHNAPLRTLGDLFTTRVETDTVTLTLVPKLQQAAASALASYPGGSVVVLNPSTGAIEAMASNPSFNPNPLASLDPATERQAYAADTAGNPGGPNFPPAEPLAYADTFAPGSSFKIVTTSAAYTHAPQLVTKSFPAYSCLPPGSIQGQTTPLCNYADEYCGGDIAQLLPPSCDTGYSLLSVAIGAQSMYDEATAYGFDQQPPIDLPHSPYEVSVFPTPAQLRHADIFLAFSGIGQKYTSATPLQMAMVAATVANGGKEMVPHVMQVIRDAQGNVVERFTPKVWKTPISAATAAAITGLMHSVTTATNGTAYGVFNPADDVAAKTGTAQVGPNNALTNDWMIAFAPASHPTVAVAVCLPNQPGQGTGAGEAGPIANRMITTALGQ